MNTSTLAPRSDRQGERPWSVGSPPSSYVLTNVRAVLDERVTDAATVVVEDGVIAAVEESSGRYIGDLDGGNRLLLPGLIDVHSDALEKERAPRPSAVLPWDFALASFESKLVGAGVTTIFHGAGFQHKVARGVARAPELALELCAAVGDHRGRRVDHRVLHRFAIRSEGGAALLRQRLAALPADGPPPLLSHEDHTPGQGQYADRAQLEASIVGSEGITAAQAQARIDGLVEEARHTEETRRLHLEWLAELAGEGRIRLLGHDPDSAEEIDALVARGGVVAEFPTTLEAAARARELGLTIVAGAPNALRGESHSGNVSAAELISGGLADALASDYLPTALLASVFKLARSGVVSLSTAVGLVTSGPARVAGLADRGEIVVGHLADFALVDDTDGRWPHVISTMKSDRGQDR